VTLGALGWDAADALVKLALAGGASDNVTAVAVAADLANPE
jgi:serine/threonine protein phosphatase PrpC